MLDVLQVSGAIAIFGMASSALIAWGTMRARMADTQIEIMRLRDAVHRHGNLLGEVVGKLDILTKGEIKNVKAV